MILSAVVLARVLFHLETVDLNPRGTVFFPDLLKGLVEKFCFQKYPQTFEETDENKGINFFEGTFGGITVDKLSIFSGTLVLDTSASTSSSEEILHQALAWASEEFGITYLPSMVRRRQYLSDITFNTDVPILEFNAAVASLRSSLNAEVTGILGYSTSYAPIRFEVDFDKTERPVPSASFSIHRRGGVPFADNKYFSEAPLPTDVHIRLLEKFESDFVEEIARRRA